MNRRLLVAGILVMTVGGGLVSSAMAAQPDATRHKICVDHKQLLPNGFCVVWDDPLGAASR